MAQTNNTANDTTNNLVGQTQLANFIIVTPQIIAADGGVVRRRIACVACKNRRKKVRC